MRAHRVREERGAEGLAANLDPAGADTPRVHASQVSGATSSRTHGSPLMPRSRRARERQRARLGPRPLRPRPALAWPPGTASHSLSAAAQHSTSQHAAHGQRSVARQQQAAAQAERRPHLRGEGGCADGGWCGKAKVRRTSAARPNWREATQAAGSSAAAAGRPPARRARAAAAACQLPSPASAAAPPARRAPRPRTCAHSASSHAARHRGQHMQHAGWST